MLDYGLLDLGLQHRLIWLITFQDHHFPQSNWLNPKIEENQPLTIYTYHWVIIDRISSSTDFQDPAYISMSIKSGICQRLDINNQKIESMVV